MSFFIRAFYLIMLSCNPHGNATLKPASAVIRCINVTYKLPIVDEKTGNVFSIQDSCKMFFKDNLIMYKIDYRHRFIFKDSTVNQIRSDFFIYEKNHDTGYNYNAYEPENNRKMRVDSVLGYKAFTQLNIFYQLFQKNELILVSSFDDSLPHYLEEKYVTRGKKDLSDFDTAFFYFTDKLDGIDFSLMKSLDSVKKLKLFRLRFLTIPTYYPEYKISVKEREFYFDVKEIPVVNSKEILDYFERYKKDHYKRTPAN
jgi:hypothetical protein